MNGRVAIVTGATSGIGRAIAERFASNGCSVVVSGRNAARGNEVVSGIVANGGKAFFFQGDVKDENVVNALFDKTLEVFGTVDILVNNVGISPYNPISNVTSEEWDDVFANNVKSYFLCCKKALPIMKERGYGRIVNIGSRGYLGARNLVSYSASKGAIFSMTRSLALDYAKDGITVNCVAPGMIETPLFRGSSSDADIAKRLENQPMGKVGSPETIASAAEYFAREENWFTTGQTLHVCGGMSI